MKAMIDEFDGDAWAMVAFAWAVESSNPYPASVTARMVKTDMSTEKVTQGELERKKPEMLMDLSRVDIIAQGGVIRRRVKDAIHHNLYQFIDAKFTVPCDPHTRMRKKLAIDFVMDYARQHVTCNERYLFAVACSWGGADVSLGTLIDLSGVTDRQERNRRKKIFRILNERLNDSMVSVRQAAERRLI